VDPCSAWTAKANKRVQFGYGLNYLIDIENAVIVDVEATPDRVLPLSISRRPSRKEWSGSECCPLALPRPPAMSAIAPLLRDKPTSAAYPERPKL
jgi:hypothetical protein